MKRITCVGLCVCLIMMLFCGCESTNGGQSDYSDQVIIEEVIVGGELDSTSSNIIGENQTSQPNSSVVSGTESSDCAHQYDEKIVQKAELFKAGTKSYTCNKCGDSYTKTYPVEEIKLLSISNSYGKNALWELPEICKQAGVKKVDVAVMYIGGCSLDQHWENIQKNNAAYEVFRNSNGTWTSTLNCSIEDLLSEGGWDIISLQSKSGQAGMSSYFTNLDNVAGYVSNKCPNAKILWHMTWAYQKDCQYLSDYQNDDILMYNKIVECAKSQVVPNAKIHSVVPVGTAIMNARTSRLKNQVHQSDGSHLSEDIGYYVGAFTWFGHLTGMPLYDVNLYALNPTVSQNIDVIRECAGNALKNPYQITQSYYVN